MKAQLGIVATLFALSFVVLMFTQSCGTNPTAKNPGKAPGKSAGGTTGNAQADQSAGQQPTGGTQTQAGSGSTTATTSGSGTTGTTGALSSHGGSTGEIPSGSGSSSGNSSAGVGECVDTDNEGPNQFPEAENKGQGLAYYTPDDNFKCCKNDAQQKWDCYEGNTYTNSQSYSDYPGNLPILPN